MRQRAMIAMAISCNPEILIADEPTTALDVTIQAQIIEVVKEMQAQYNSGVILITHDLGVVAEMSDKIMVMYGGRTVEYGPVDEIFYNPHHPYTWGLLGSLPRLDLVEKTRLTPIKGNPPDLITLAERLPVLRPLRLRAAGCHDNWPESGDGRPGARRPLLDPARRADRPPRQAAALQGDGRVSLLEVANLKKHFPDPRQPAQAQQRQGVRRRRRLVLGREGPDARPGGRERLRQVDDGPRGPAAHRGHRRAACSSTGWTSCRRGAPRCSGCGATCRSSSRTRTRP